MPQRKRALVWYYIFSSILIILILIITPMKMIMIMGYNTQEVRSCYALMNCDAYGFKER